MLVIRPRYVGDVCLTLPVLTNLQRIVPHAAIHYLVEEEAAPLLAEDPRLKRVWIASRRAGALAQARLYADLHAARFDLVLDLFCNPRTALWTAATGARWRAGYPGKRLRSAAYNIAVKTDATSAIRFHLASLEALGWETEYAIPDLRLTDGELKAAWNHLTERGVPAGTPLIGFHPGARWPTRRWAPEDFIALGKSVLAKRSRAWILVFAGPGEEELARTIASGIGSPRAIAITHVALRRFAALVRLCQAFVGGDSGPIHVSVAVGTPTIGVFGRNLPEMFFPYPESAGHRAVYARVWCSPCHRNECDHLSCLRAISPDWVGEVLESTLAHAEKGEGRAPTPLAPVPNVVLGAPRPRPAT
ncbi:MAG: glycosyltransferase family 9 protein [Candidatus Eiseniibacteriota bacterium]